MTLFATEIDQYGRGNKTYLNAWEEKHGSILQKLSTHDCINCIKKLKDDDSIYYVTCHSGVLHAWHKECVKSPKK